MYSYSLEKRAQNEYEASVDWYAEKSEQVTLNFIHSIDKTLELICKQPLSYKKCYKQFHEVVVKKYPFSIIYSIDEKAKTIRVFSFFHHKRNPSKKFRK